MMDYNQSHYTARYRKKRRFWPVLIIIFAVLALLFVRFKPVTLRSLTVPDWVTQDFITPNQFSRPETALKRINGVVVHYVGNPGTTAQQNRDFFDSLSETGQTYASSHFIIDTDGTVIQCVPLDEIAYCSNSRNGDTVSIEVCHPDDTGEFTQASYESLIRLLDWLSDERNLGRDEIFRHSDVFTETLCPLYYMEHPDKWEQLKDDVFMS